MTLDALPTWQQYFLGPNVVIDVLHGFILACTVGTLVFLSLALWEFGRR